MMMMDGRIDMRGLVEVRLAISFVLDSARFHVTR